MQEAIELKFRYTEKDYIEFLRHYAILGRGRRMLWWMLIAVAFAAVALQFRENVGVRDVFGVMVALLLFIFMWWMILQSSGKRMFRHNPQLQENRRVDIRQDGFTVHGETFVAEYQWADTIGFAETKNNFLLFTGPMSAVILPKRAFDAAQVQVFREIVAGGQPVVGV